MNPDKRVGSNSAKNDTKHRDYLVQQEKLRSMAHSTTAVKALDADRMIENLLSRSETFMKQKGSTHTGLPAWLICGSSSLPKVYRSVWLSAKSKSTTGPQEFCDTQFLTSVLLTSGISTECLGHIWALCNKTAPGLLTEQELYQVLALIALAQLGRPWNSITVLQKLQEPVVPCLNYNLLAMSPTAPDHGIHSTYLPNRMAMSIPSPVQTFQNTTNTVLSNSKTSLELNPSLLESMLSNNLSQKVATFTSSNPQMNNLPNNLPQKHSDSDFSDSWTDFIDHTASVNQSNPGSNVTPIGSSISFLTSLDSSKSISSKDVTFSDSANQSDFGGFNKISLSNPIRDNSKNTAVPNLSMPNDIMTDLTSLTLPPSNISQTEKSNENDDEFTDFQSFDSNSAKSQINLASTEVVSSNIESLMTLSLGNDSSSKAAPKIEVKNGFSSNESDEVIYGQKGYVVENPLYLSDNDSIYDSNSVRSLKFDSVSLDADSSQGMGLNFLSAPVNDTKIIQNSESENKSLPTPQFIQVPSLISGKVSEDKYSVFRMLEIHENPQKEMKIEEDEFGDFLTADFTEPKDETPKSQESILDSPSPSFFSEPIVSGDHKTNTDHPKTQSLQETCMNACISVLRNAVEKFSSLNPDVLKLVLCEDKCIDYIQALTEIYRIAEKMIQSVNNELHKEDLTNVWKDLNSYVSTKFSIEECEEENDYDCTLCNSNSGSAVIKYGTSYYHVPCINFYLNCVDCNLPD